MTCPGPVRSSGRSPLRMGVGPRRALEGQGSSWRIDLSAEPTCSQRGCRRRPGRAIRTSRGWWFEVLTSNDEAEGDGAQCISADSKSATPVKNSSLPPLVRLWAQPRSSPQARSLSGWVRLAPARVPSGRVRTGRDRCLRRRAGQPSTDMGRGTTRGSRSGVTCSPNPGPDRVRTWFHSRRQVTRLGEPGSATSLPSALLAGPSRSACRATRSARRGSAAGSSAGTAASRCRR